MKWCAFVGALALCSAMAFGQRPSAPKTPRAPTGAAGPTSATTGQGSADEYGEAPSRRLFSACDGNSDDRLDLLEACDALDTLGDPADPSGFRRLDQDRDGYMTWPEFDHHFRSVIQRGAIFRVRTCRRLAAEAPEQQAATTATPVQKFLKLHDKNGNGGIDPGEADQFVRDAGLPPAIGTQLKALDLDKSGRIEAAELASFLSKLKGAAPAGTPEGKQQATELAPAWQAMDTDGDGALNLAEWTQALRRMDPTLANWAPRLLQNADRNQNGVLNAEELAAIKKPTAATQ